MRRLLKHLRTLFILVFCFFPTLGNSALLTGKATLDEKPVAGITAQAFPVTSLSLNAPAPYNSAPTTDNGRFQLNLPPGEYYLIAKGKDLFTYYGRNPVAVPAVGLQGINFLLVPRQGTVTQGEPKIDAGVLGTVTRDGKPVAGAVTYIYSDLDSHLKGFGLGMAAPTDRNGFFEVPLPAGSYYLVVRLRQDGALAGPMRAGDLFGYLATNPIEIGESQVIRVHIPLIEVPEKVERFATNLFGNTSIRGQVVDKNGKPVPGIRAMLYNDSMMLERPAFVSQPSDRNGRFVLSFPNGGTYYLAARGTLGGTPKFGELYGR